LTFREVPTFSKFRFQTDDLKNVLVKKVTKLLTFPRKVVSIAKHNDHNVDPTQIALSATKVDSDPAIRSLAPSRRKCLFANENQGPML
jgi:hypothetical protein